MDPDRWARVESLFHRALGLPRAERDAWLRVQCVGDDDLHAEVARLIAADTGAHALVDQLERGALHAREDPLIGREIGAYRLTKRIGAGGMGLVYEAERTDGLFRHQVAIKLIRVELATETLVQRFELERRTLAGLNHPNIAQLHDGGTTPDGRPYLVMELVRGTPIDRYCDAHELSVEDRLRLFVQVCRGVHYAHQNLVVHRDLKPGNVLVDESGVPKLLDFGIARLLDESAVDAGISPTLTVGQILTPDYASPEQLTLGPVTTAMDVYSLGVVLYELLTGRRPFKSENKSPVEWHRDVLERAPTRPSSVVTTVDLGTPPSPSAEISPQKLAALRGASPRSLQRRLRGDIDRIVLMTLRKEPQRRYASAKDLADDVERHLTGHPVQARADSFAYRTSKFVQRNKIAVGAGIAVAAALIVGIVFAVQGERRAREGEAHATAQARHARIEADSFRSIADFLMSAFLTTSEKLEPGKLEERRKLVQLYAARLRREYGSEQQEHLRANLLDSLGMIAQQLGFSSDAEDLVREAMAIRSKSFGETDLEYALSLSSLGRLYYDRGELPAAAEAFTKALAIHRMHAVLETHTDVATVANDLAACLRALGKLDEAEALHAEALALRRAKSDASLDVAESLNNSAGIDLDRSKWSAAAKKLEEALAIRRQILGDGDPLTIQSMSNLAQVLWRMSERDRAYAFSNEAEKGARALQVHGEEDLARILMNRASMLISEHKSKDAVPLLDEALALQIRRLGADHPSVASTLERQARVHSDLKEYVEARSTWERALTIRRSSEGSPRALGQSLNEYGMFLWRTKALDEARSALAEAVEVLRKSGASKSTLLGRAELAYGEVLLESGDAAAARPHLEQAVSIFETAPGETEDLAEAKSKLELSQAPSKQ